MYFDSVYIELLRLQIMYTYIDWKDCGKYSPLRWTIRDTAFGSVEIMVNLPYGQSTLQVDLDTIYVHAFDVDT